MKRYTIGLITGILLTASAFMFMGETQTRVGRFVPSTGLWVIDTVTGDMYYEGKLNHIRK